MFQVQAEHLGKKCLHYACFTRNLRTTIFRNISEQLFQQVSQTIFHMLLQDTTPSLQYLLFFLFVKIATFPCAFSESVNLTFRLHLTLDIPRAYSEPQWKI